MYRISCIICMTYEDKAGEMRAIFRVNEVDFAGVK
jgi:hypothetical protein